MVSTIGYYESGRFYWNEGIGLLLCRRLFWWGGKCTYIYRYRYCVSHPRVKPFKTIPKKCLGTLNAHTKGESRRRYKYYRHANRGGSAGLAGRGVAFVVSQKYALPSAGQQLKRFPCSCSVAALALRVWRVSLLAHSTALAYAGLMTAGPFFVSRKDAGLGRPATILDVDKMSCYVAEKVTGSTLFLCWRTRGRTRVPS